MSTAEKLRSDKENAHNFLVSFIKALLIYAGIEEKTVPVRQTSDNITSASNNTVKTSSNKNHTENTVSISELMKNYGVTPEDFQAVYKSNPEIISAIGGGNTCQKLAKAADGVVTRYSGGKPLTGKCLPGARAIYQNAGVDSLSCNEAQRAMLSSRMPYQKNNGGGNGYVALEASGDYLTIKVDNIAYGKPKVSQENQTMNSILCGVQPGITVTLDSIEDNSDRQKAGNTAGGKYGHIVVKRSDGNWGCDFNQRSINYSRYGKYARVCVPKDAEVSSEFAQMLIEQAKMRQQQTQIQNQQIITTRNQTR